MVAAANAPLSDPERNRKIGAGENLFELYHFGLSICSHKVRAVLAEKEASYVSHDIAILPPLMENYHPGYVRLRLHGGRGREFVNGYTGRSSISTEGFDPCVVPTLVDKSTGTVLVDSTAICDHVAASCESGTDLLPHRSRRDIADEIAIVDRTPHVALLYGAHPEGDFRPAKIRQQMPRIHDYKIMKLMEGRSLAVGDPDLISAYDSKIIKEAAARSFVATPDMMRSAVAEALKIVGELETRLEDGRHWVCGGTYTMADVFWAVSLFRLKWLGMDFCWKGGHRLNDAPRNNVGAYAGRLFDRESFKTAVVEWPTNPPSEFVADHYPDQSEGTRDRKERRQLKPGEHGRDLREENLTSAVLETMKETRNPRARKILNAFTRHLHAFLEEVEPTEEEWEFAIDFLTRTGQMCKDGRQEFVLLSDVTGATARVDMINHRFLDGATENSVLGPFFIEDRPHFESGADISGGLRGEPLLVSIRVLDPQGNPVNGARVDIWHSDDDGSYDIMNPSVEGTALRGVFRSDHDGRVWFTSILPASYPIPDDGPVGELLNAANRSPMRPAHVHVRVTAPGFVRLTTMMFVEGDQYLDSDPVFGVKDSLIIPFRKRTGLRAPDGARVPDPCFHAEYEFVLSRRR
ncbi:MAG: glutathione S-transferase C-terminal domain-containing protein [Albidovulum sp.]|nr:glutathione S-transferase C-terminal domain-containing protein [Albidovulum sp.]